MNANGTNGTTMNRIDLAIDHDATPTIERPEPPVNLAMIRRLAARWIQLNDRRDAAYAALEALPDRDKAAETALFRLHDAKFELACERLAEVDDRLYRAACRAGAVAPWVIRAGDLVVIVTDDSPSGEDDRVVVGDLRREARIGPPPTKKPKTPRSK